MTIDMLRHTSLREIVARALYDSPPPPAGTWPVPTAAHGASFAVRNLPHDTDPERAVSFNGGYCRSGPGAKTPPRCQGLESPCPKTSPRLHAALARGSA